MKCFVAVEEELLQALWQQDPRSVVPFSRPLYACQVHQAPSSDSPISEHHRRVGQMSDLQLSEEYPNSGHIPMRQLNPYRKRLNIHEQALLPAEELRFDLRQNEQGG
jgi:hypothetical protein